MAKATKEDILEEGIEDAGTDSAETRVYELGFHIDPELGAEEVKKVYQTIRSTVTSLGTIVAEGEPTKIQLAYTMYISNTAGRRDFNTAFFAWIAYEANTDSHGKITATASAESRIIRFIDLKTEKEAAKHASEMHEIFAKATETESDEEEEKEVELDAALKEVAA